MHILAGWLLNVFLTVLLSGLAVMFSDTIIGLILQVMDMFVAGANTIGTDFDIPDIQSLINSLPPEILWVLKRVRFDDMMAIIVAAYTVRIAASVLRFGRVAQAASPDS